MKNPIKNQSIIDIKKPANRILLFLLAFMVLAAWPTLRTYAQAPGGVAITDTPTSPVSDNSAILDLQSGQRGFLPPRMTTSLRNAIESPAIGLTVFNTTHNCLQFFNGEGWFNLCDGNVSVMGAIANLDCSNAEFTGVLVAGVPASGVSAVVGYTGGNGGYHNGQTVTSTGVTGLTATLAAGDFATGTGTFTYTITGTPDGGGTAGFTLSIGGETCELAVNVSSFPACSPPTVTDIDGNVYNTVLIGGQCWMKENLKTTKYRNETAIENPIGNDAWLSNTIGAYAWYNNDTSWKESYGALFNWYAVNNANGLCPTNWHVPSDAEFTQLVDFVVSLNFPNNNAPDGAGNALKSCRQVNSPLGGECNTLVHPRWNSNSTHHGFDEFGFSALPGGYCNDGSFGGLGTYGFWWSSTEYAGTSVWHRNMYYGFGGVNCSNGNKRLGYSVRCLRDN